MNILNPRMHQIENGSFVDAVQVKVTGDAMYKNAFEVLRLVNAERQKRDFRHSRWMRAFCRQR